VSTWPFVAIAAALATILVARKARDPLPRVLLPLATAVIFVCAWHISCELMAYDLHLADGTVRHIELFPTPWETLVEMRQPILDGTLARYAVASIYRIAVGFGIAVFIGVPLGLWAGWFLRGAQAINPLIQALRPISPIAWIPLAVLWFGVKDASAIFLVTLASFFPIVTGSMTAVRTIPTVYVRSAQNFGLEGFELFRRVIFPASLPAIITSLRFALGIAWMVIVAAEMIAVDSGLGYMIMDSRNANNYERVVGSMVVIGLLGVCLDWTVRRLEHFDIVRWGYPGATRETEVERTRAEIDRYRAKISGTVMGGG
jgi:NitT/TauT family transport system permease protein